MAQPATGRRWSCQARIGPDGQAGMVEIEVKIEVDDLQARTARGPSGTLKVGCTRCSAGLRRA